MLEALGDLLHQLAQRAPAQVFARLVGVGDAVGQRQRAVGEGLRVAGVGVKLEKVAPGEYRAWLKKDVMARYKAPSASAGFGVLLLGGSNPGQVTSVELRASPLSEDARALLQRAR